MKGSDGHVDGIDMCLRFHSSLPSFAKMVRGGPFYLRPAFLFAMAARARAKLDEMNSYVRLRGVRHLC